MTKDEFEDRLADVNKQIDRTAAQTQPPALTKQEWWTTQNAMTMSSVVLVFGVAIILLAAILVRQGTASEEVLRVFGTIVIIVMAVFLVIVGYTDQQIAPAMGLLGTIAGYLLGKETKTKGEKVT